MDGPADGIPMEHRFRRAMTDSSIGVAIVSPEGRFLRVNDALCSLFGIQREALVQLSWQELTHPDDLATDEELVRSASEGRTERYRINKRYLHADGHMIFAELTVTVVRDDDGILRYFVSQIVDQTERLLSAEALRRSDEMHRGLFAALAEGVLVQDERLVIVAANPAVERIMGFETGQMLGLTTTDPSWPLRRADGTVMPVEEHPNLVALRTGRPQRNVLVGVERADGRAIWLEAHSELLRDDAGVVSGVVTSFSDVTEREEAQRVLHDFAGELERSVAARTIQLEAANEELRTFSSAVSHDLRGPVRAVASFAGLMLREDAGDLSDRARHRLENIVEAGETMGRLIDDLAAYKRLGQGALHHVAIPLEPLVEHVRMLLEPRLLETGGRLACEGCDASPVADPMLLERILLNLVDNALAYRRPDIPPVVVVSSGTRAGRVTVSVRDNGEGIASDVGDRVFDVFTRLRADGDPSHTGTGLATVRKAARAMGGDVTYRSQLGMGTTFLVDLPAA